jgi:hypothetical protein
MSVRKAPWILLIVLAIGLPPWPRVMAPPQSQTVHIIDTRDDGFVTEAGIGIDSSLAHILDPGMDIRAFLVFREISVDFWEPLTNATLRLRTSNTLAFDNDSSVTVYGIKLADLQDEGFLGPSFIMSAPLTSASVNVNTSQFYGQTWHDIDVTAIVEELIRNPRWDGEGTPGGWAGDDIGFIILGAPDDTRYFYDYRGNPSYSADLVIHWNHAPTPPVIPNPVFNETYRGYNIWNSTGSYFDIHLIDYSEWPTTVDVGGWLYVYNTTGINPYNIDMSDKIRKSNATADSPFGNNGSILLRLDAYDIRNFGGPDLNRLNWALISFCNVDGSMVDNHGGAGFEHASITVRHNADNSTNDIFRFANFIDSALGASTSNTIHFGISQSPFYLNITWDFSAQYLHMDIYDDEDMTVLLDSTNHGPGYGGIQAGGYNFHMVFNTYTLGPPWLGTMQNITVVSEGSVSPDVTWTVTYENGTIVCQGLGDYEDALLCIENELGADPEDPDPPGEEWPETGPFTRFRTRAYFFILGFACFFGPVWFFAWKRPSGYYILVGALIMLIGVGLLIQVMYV